MSHSTLLRSPRLGLGDTFGVVSPSWFGGEPYLSRAQHGIRHLQSLGFKVKVAEHAFGNRGHVSDTAENRAADINAMFADPDVRALLCTIGGTHSVDVLRYLDWDLIRSNPKPFIGYSDSTTVNVALHAATGLNTINGPYLLSDWAEFPQMPKISQDWILKLLMTPEAPGVLPYPPLWTNEFVDWTTGADRARARRYRENEGWKVLRGGVAEGPLVGGCLECLSLLWGSEYWPDLEGAMLFLETAADINSPYATDELMAGLEMTGALDKISGLLFAKPSAFSAGDRGIFESLLAERLGRYSFPVVMDMDFGHHTPMIAMPLGPRTRVSTDPLEITILESPVT